MRKHWASVIVMVTLLSGTRALGLPGDVVGSFPTPAAHPTGLAYDGTHLWVADRLTDSLYALDLAKGGVVHAIPAPGYAISGLTWDGTCLWYIDDEEARIGRFDPATGKTLHSFEAPTPGPQGIAWDGARLWISDPRSDLIAQISTDDGTTIEEFPAPMNTSTGLCWWNGYLWSGDRVEDKIYLISPAQDGEVVIALGAPGKHVRGLATISDRLFAVDYQDDTISEMVIEDNEVLRQHDPVDLDLLLTYEIRNYGPGTVTDADIYIALPADELTQALHTAPQFDPQPTAILEDRYGQKVAHFHLSDLPLAERNRITMQVTAQLASIQQVVFPHKVGPLKEIPREIRTLYLEDAEKYRTEDPRIVTAMREAIGDESNPYWMMRRIHKYIRDRLHYELAGGWNVAPRVLERGNGSCSEYTFLFISMCRAAGIPARYVGSLVVRGDEASTDEVFHRWSQVYLPRYGWIHVDPQGGDKEKPGQVAQSIGCLDNRFLLTTFSGGGSEYLGWSYNYDSRWQAEGVVKVHTETVAEWSPAKLEQ